MSSRPPFHHRRRADPSHGSWPIPVLAQSSVIEAGHVLLPRSLAKMEPVDEEGDEPEAVRALTLGSRANFQASSLGGRGDVCDVQLSRYHPPRLAWIL